jgi:hypothetical protein
MTPGAKWPAGTIAKLTAPGIDATLRLELGGPEMNDANITRSVESDRDGIGLRAALHMERVFRTLTAGIGGESKDDYFRWITREPHPLGNVVFQSVEFDAPSARSTGRDPPHRRVRRRVTASWR